MAFGDVEAQTVKDQGGHQLSGGGQASVAGGVEAQHEALALLVDDGHP